MYFLFFVRLFLEQGRRTVKVGNNLVTRQACKPAFGFSCCVLIISVRGLTLRQRTTDARIKTTMRMFKYTAVERPPFSFLQLQRPRDSITRNPNPVGQLYKYETRLFRNLFRQRYIKFNHSILLSNTTSRPEQHKKRGSTWRKRAEILQHTFIVSTLKNDTV